MRHFFFLKAAETLTNTFAAILMQKTSVTLETATSVIFSVLFEK